MTCSVFGGTLNLTQPKVMPVFVPMCGNTRITRLWLLIVWYCDTECANHACETAVFTAAQNHDFTGYVRLVSFVRELILFYVFFIFLVSDIMETFRNLDF